VTTIAVDARELQGRPTGTGRYLRSLLRQWARAGHDRLLLYFNGPAPADPVLAHPSIQARPLGQREVRGFLWQQSRVPRAVREDAPDVFFAPAYSCPLRLAVPCVTTVHDFSFFSHPQDFTLADALRRRLLVRASVRASARVLVVSDFTRRELVFHAPEAEGRVVRVPHGAGDDLPPAPPRGEARARLGVSGPLILSVGSIFNRRCLPSLLQAVARLVRAWPKLVLDVVGDNRTHPRLDLPRLAERLGVRAHIRFSGFVSDEGLAARYAAADAFVFLSEYEGFGLPVLEAMARGLPVVTADRPATSEIFGGSALLVQPQDPAGIADALARLLGDAGLRHDLVGRGRALAGRHSWAEAAAATRAALEEAARA
jgi:glycosyltransferase involved in cell wall biosynthesis